MTLLGIRVYKLLLLGALLALGLMGCSSYNGPAPVVNAVGVQGPYWKVRPGDTLYSIAWSAGYDFKTLAANNNISAPYAIYPGQTIRLTLKAKSVPSGGYVVRRGDNLTSIARRAGISVPQLIHYNGLRAPYRIFPGQRLSLTSTGSSKTRQTTPYTAPIVTRAPKSRPTSSVPAKPSKTKNTDKTRVSATNKPQKTQQKSALAHNRGKIKWRWPTIGPVIAKYSLSETGNKGIDLGGRFGQPIYASASGVVVYAGSALVGYGQLIIIKHNDDYLSAYAHNSRIRVKEQQIVKVGQWIADMGNSGAPNVRLHFEIRFRGKSIDPMRVLPKR